LIPATRVSALSLALAAGLLGGCAPPGPPLPAPDDVVRVRVLHTNDFHGHLLPQTTGGRAVGGSAVLAAHFDSARARFQGPTILLSAGDDLQGTAVSNLSWGRATIDVLNRKGYDAAALGNHEFDWGQDTLRARIAESGFPWLAANIFMADTDHHPEWVRPWVMIERDGVRVAVVGLALENTAEVVVAGRTDGLEFRSAPAALDRYVPEARAAGAHFVVATAHMGAVCAEPGEGETGRSAGCENRIIEVAWETGAPVDLFVAGHTHLRNLIRVDGVPINQAHRYGVAYGVVDLERRGGRVRTLRQEIHMAWADGVDPDTALARVVGAWGEAVRPMTERVVAELAEPLGNQDRQPGEFALGNLLADAQRVATDAHVGFVNTGAIRRGLPAGPVTWGMLFELQPFQNEMVTADLTGAVLKAALEAALGGDGRPRAHVSGLVVGYDPDSPTGGRVRTMVLDDGRVIEAGDTVTVALTDFVAGGGDGYSMFREERWRRADLLDLDALLDYLAARPQPVTAPTVGRWRIER
jgi:2',3'-cyclic-nucleotide 2'-phosphodiesterase (5'-nucleotidase family)